MMLYVNDDDDIANDDDMTRCLMNIFINQEKFGSNKMKRKKRKKKHNKIKQK